MGAINENLTYEINYEASVKTAQLAKNVGVEKFIFSSSCSLYGVSDGETALDENSDFAPVTAYAISKVKTEKELLLLSNSDYSVTFMRNATAYGLSPKLRLDLVVNNLAVLLLDQRSDSESHAKALQLAMRFSKSSHAAVIDTLGWAYYRNDNLDNAIQYLEIAVSMSDGTPSLHYHLGMAYYARQNTETARQQLQKSITLAQAAYPGIDEARETLNNILNSSSAQ